MYISYTGGPQLNRLYRYYYYHVVSRVFVARRGNFDHFPGARVYVFLCPLLLKRVFYAFPSILHTRTHLIRIAPYDQKTADIPHKHARARNYTVETTFSFVAIKSDFNSSRPVSDAVTSFTVLEFITRYYYNSCKIIPRTYAVRRTFARADDYLFLFNESYAILAKSLCHASSPTRRRNKPRTL